MQILFNDARLKLKINSNLYESIRPHISSDQSNLEIIFSYVNIYIYKYTSLSRAQIVIVRHLF